MPGLGFFNFGVPAAAVGVGAGSAGVGEWRDDDDDDDDELLSQDAMSFPYSKLSLPLAAQWAPGCFHAILLGRHAGAAGNSKSVTPDAPSLEWWVVGGSSPKMAFLSG